MIKNAIFEHFKNSKFMLKTPQKNSKNSKSHIRRSQIKKFQKDTLVGKLKIIKNDISYNFKSPETTPKYFKKFKYKYQKIDWC